MHRRRPSHTYPLWCTKLIKANAVCMGGALHPRKSTAIARHMHKLLLNRDSMNITEREAREINTSNAFSNYDRAGSQIIPLNGIHLIFFEYLPKGASAHPELAHPSNKPYGYWMAAPVGVTHNVRCCLLSLSPGLWLRPLQTNTHISLTDK